jgi:hypothetical protein
MLSYNELQCKRAPPARSRARDRNEIFLFYSQLVDCPTPTATGQGLGAVEKSGWWGEGGGEWGGYRGWCLKKKRNTRKANKTSSKHTASTIRINIQMNQFYVKFEREKIEELKFVQKQRERTHGVDVYSLAIGSGSTDTTVVNKFADVN